MRAGGPNRDTPVIVVTVVAEKGAGIGFHVHDMLVKPVLGDQLLASLKRAQLAPDNSRPILVVDDDAQALKLADKALHQLGYRAICRSNAKSALQAVREARPAAVILDLAMPEIDGFEFLKRFRQSAADSLFVTFLPTYSIRREPASSLRRITDKGLPPSPKGGSPVSRANRTLPRA